MKQDRRRRLENSSFYLFLFIYVYVYIYIHIHTNRVLLFYFPVRGAKKGEGMVIENTFPPLLDSLFPFFFICLYYIDLAYRITGLTSDFSSHGVISIYAQE